MKDLLLGVCGVSISRGGSICELINWDGQRKRTEGNRLTNVYCATSKKTLGCISKKFTHLQVHRQTCTFALPLILTAMFKPPVKDRYWSLWQKIVKDVSSIASLSTSESRMAEPFM